MAPLGGSQVNWPKRHFIEENSEFQIFEHTTREEK